ncbi:MAG: hypothetical protein AAFX94_04830, partial [Myxococcota bacterium]
AALDDLGKGGGPVAVAAAKSLERVAFERGDRPRERLALEYLAAHSEGEEQVESYERFVDALYRYGEHRALENATQQLLSLDPKSPTGHLRMAQRLESDENFNEALMYYERLLLETKRDRLDRNVRRDAFVHAAGLAHEIKPDLIPRMQEAFDFEFPEAPDDALDRTLSDLLRDEERWNELYRLRRSQIEWVGEAKQIAFQSDIAELLHHRLDRVEESIPYYQNVIASSRDPSTARDALVDVFERLGRWGDLASHLFAMSQLEADRPRAVAFGLRSARVFGDELKDWPGAQQVLRTLLSDPENDWRFGGLMDALRDYRLDSELSLLTEKSLEAEPSPDDGRLEELVGLLVEVLNDPTRALRWTKELVDRYPQSDDPRRLHGRILGDYPTLGDQKGWLAEWAEAREGAVKARVLLKLAAVHHDDGEFAEEVATLRQAAETEPDNVQTLELLVERIIARGDWDATLPWLEQLAQIARDPDEHDTRWRRLIEVAIDYADDSVLAIRGLESLHSPSVVFIGVPSDLRQLLEPGQRGVPIAAGDDPFDQQLKSLNVVGFGLRSLSKGRDLFGKLPIVMVNRGELKQDTCLYRSLPRLRPLGQPPLLVAEGRVVSEDSTVQASGIVALRVPVHELLRPSESAGGVVQDLDEQADQLLEPPIVGGRLRLKRLFGQERKLGVQTVVAEGVHKSAKAPVVLRIAQQSAQNLLGSRPVFQLISENPSAS